MSLYEYGTGQQGLNYPNPYKFENYMLSAKVVIFIIASIYLFFLARHNLQAKEMLSLAISISAAITFLFLAIKNGLIVSKQLRVYFGRGQPAGLAPEISPDKFGTTHQANKLKETIRQSAIYIDAPPGNLNGFLYTQFKDLIIAPKEIQQLFQHCFGNIVKMLTLFALFILSAFLAVGSNLNGWLGMLYSAVALILILKPLFKTELNNVNLNLTNFWILLGLTLAVTIGFVFVQDKLPNVAQYNFGWQTLVLAIFAIGGELVILRALFFQLEKPLGLTTAFQQEAITFNANPGQLSIETERKLQDSWNLQVPHRIYSRLHPYISPNAKTGEFSSEIIQETQPTAPKALENGMTLETVLADNRKKHLFIVNIMAVVVALVSTIGLAYIFTEAQALNTVDYETLAWLPLLLGTLGLSMYWMKIIHGLWGRFDFESKLYIIETTGNYVTSNVNFGNAIKDSLQAQKDVITCDNMTLRVWVTHLKTSVFGHGITGDRNGLNTRRIIFMTGLKDESIAWVNQLKDFATTQSMLVSPTSSVDIERMTKLSQMNNIGTKLSNVPLLNLGAENAEQIEKLAHINLNDLKSENSNVKNAQFSESSSNIESTINAVNQDVKEGAIIVAAKKDFDMTENLKNDIENQ